MWDSWLWHPRSSSASNRASLAESRRLPLLRRRRRHYRRRLLPLWRRQSMQEAQQPSGALALDAGLGGWIESASYKFKVSGVTPCALPGPVRSASHDGSAESVPEDRPLRVGVTVHVFAKFDELFVAGRDVTIEKDGVIIRPEIDPKPSAGCSPLLEPRTLRHDQVASGVVVFQVPDEAFVRSSVIAYEPTRWGGAPRVQVRVADLKMKPFKASQAATAKPGK